MTKKADSTLSPFISFLRASGYKPKALDEHHLTFRRQGFSYILLLHEDDPCYFHLVIPDIAPAFESRRQHEAAVALANYLTDKFRVAKVVVHEGEVYASAELFVTRPADFKGIFEKAADVSAAGAFEFIQRFRAMVAGDSDDSAGEDAEPGEDPETNQRRVQ